MLNLEIIIFAVLALIAVVAAVLMITTRNAVHSALFLVVVMSTLAVFFLGLWAPFVAHAFQLDFDQGAATFPFGDRSLLLLKAMGDGRKRVYDSELPVRAKLRRGGA